MAGRQSMSEIRHIHQYINKSRNLYFLRSLIKGILLFLIFFIATGLLLLLTDLAIHFNSELLSWIRILYLFTLLFLALYYIIQPLWYWLIRHEPYTKKWVAKIIGQHEPSIDDKILNILELEEQENTDNLLVNASIKQKAGALHLDRISPFFSFKKLLHQFYLFIIILIGLLLFSLSAPDAVKYSTNRILPIGKIEQTVPYKLTLLNNTLKVDKGDGIILKTKINGNLIPDKLFLNFGGHQYLMQDSADVFSYRIRNIHQDVQFFFSNNEFESPRYQIECIPVPILKNIEVSIVPPKYTNIDAKVLEGSGNFTFPYGSQIQWKIETTNTDSVFFISQKTKPMQTDGSTFRFKNQFFKAFDYKIVPTNNERKQRDTMTFKTEMIPDRYPSIKIENQKLDALGQFQFKGIIRDDYGFHKFQFHISAKDTIITKDIPVISNNLNQTFQYSGHLKDFAQIIQNQNVEIYLKLYDNDPFFPYKSVRSKGTFGQLPGKKELNRLEDQKVSELKDKLSMGLDLMERVKKEQSEIQKKLLSKKQGNWERKQLSEQLKNTNKEIQQLSEQVNQLQKELKKLNQNNLSQQLSEKKKQLEEMLKNLMDDELKSLMKELQKLQEELQQKNGDPKLDDLDYSMEDLNKELDQNLEMLKRYEIEKKQEEVVQELENLSKQFKNSDSLADVPGKQVDSLKQKLENTLQKHSQNLEKNKQLSKPMELDEFQKEKENIRKKSNKLQQDSDLQDPDKNPSPEISDLAKSMKMNMQQAMQKQQGEDVTLIRNLLENLLRFSFKQETLIEQFNQRQSYNLNHLKREQMTMEGQFKILDDSLQALMKRNPQVALIVGNQIENIQVHFSRIQETFKAEKFQSIQVHQQAIMKSTNELILLLNESLNNMQQGMSGKGGNCKKKGKKSKPGMSGMKKQQQNFKQSLKEMIEQLKKGNSSGKGNKGMSEKLSKMLGQQEKMQQLLQQFMQSDNVGKQSRKILKQINSMIDKNIDDIVHRNINDNMVQRQEKIMNRLLESEKAEREREKEKKRRAERPNDYKKSTPDDKLDDKDDKKRQKGIIERRDLPLKYFFQSLYDNYVNEIENH